MTTDPFVTVLTPVYNGEAYLAECIESVLAQTHRNFEYIIVNNCSTDRTLEIATSYALRDDRVRVHRNREFVDVIRNHNIAFGLISPNAKYCKVVSGDDIIVPECLSRMVGAAEAHPSAGLVGCYQQRGNYVRWQGFPYPEALVSGRDLCRRIFLDDVPSFGFGSPTSLLYRADLVRKENNFYPNPSAEADTSACFNLLRECDFAFVYQVLCYDRTHDQTQSTKSARLNRYASSCVRDLREYGPLYLTDSEYEAVLARYLDYYHEFLGVSLLRARDEEFWNYHREQLKALGYPLRRSTVWKALFRKVLRESLNPEQALRKFWRLKPPRAGAAVGSC